MTDTPSTRSDRFRPSATMMPVLIFAGLYMAGAITIALMRGNTEFLLYILLMFVLIAAVGWVHRVVGLTTLSLWALAIWGFVHMAGGLIDSPSGWPTADDSRVLYNLWVIPNRLKYDNVVHAWGFGVTTWVCWQGLAAAIRGRSGVPTVTFGFTVLAVTAGLGFGALNEVVEFVLTLTVENTNVGGYVNTGWDMVSNLVGAVAAGIMLAIRGWPNQ